MKIIKKNNKLFEEQQKIIVTLQEHTLITPFDQFY